MRYLSSSELAMVAVTYIDTFLSSVFFLISFFLVSPTTSGRPCLHARMTLNPIACWQAGKYQLSPDSSTMGRHENERRYKVAIVGGGPAGLGAAIELSRLPFIDWKLYEKKPQISETGGGLSLQPHCWMLLEHNGAASNIKTTDFFRSADGVIEERR